MLGEWETTDSTTGEEKLVTFKEKTVVVFHKEKTEWVFTHQIRDSVILLDYTLYDENISGRASGVLIVRNQDCFWWFNLRIYETYQRELETRHHFSTPDQFQQFLKKCRGVYYRKK